MLIGPAIGIENMKPARIAAMDIDIKLSTTILFSKWTKSEKSEYSEKDNPVNFTN
jgi:hypothetical protein